MGLIRYIEEKRLEREREIRNEKLIGTMKVLASVGAGFTLGILFAPKSGKETRKDIANATKEGLNFVSENLNNAKNYVKDYVKDKAANIKEAVAEKYDELRNETIPEKIEDFEEDVEYTADIIEEKAEDVKEKVKK